MTQADGEHVDAAERVRPEAAVPTLPITPRPVAVGQLVEQRGKLGGGLPVQRPLQRREPEAVGSGAWWLGHAVAVVVHSGAEDDLARVRSHELTR